MSKPVWLLQPSLMDTLSSAPHPHVTASWHLPQTFLAHTQCNDLINICFFHLTACTLRARGCLSSVHHYILITRFGSQYSLNKYLGQEMSEWTLLSSMGRTVTVPRLPFLFLILTWAWFVTSHKLSQLPNGLQTYQNREWISFSSKIHIKDTDLLRV